MRRLIPVLLPVAALLAGCGGSTIRPGPTAQTVSDFVFSHTGFRPLEVKCPSGIPAKVGSTFACHFKGPDGHYTAQVRITAVHGEETLDHIVSRRTGS